MRSTTLLLLTACISSGIHAQEDRLAIREWQSLHPTTLLLSSERFNQLSDAEQLLLGDDYILFGDRISLKELQAYDASEKSAAQPADMPATKGANGLYIKKWLVANPDVKIIPKTTFTAMDEVKQQECLSDPLILILKGETLTIQDLYDYEN